MYVFQVEGMGCGSCEARIIRAIHRQEATANVTIDRSRGRVEVASALTAPEVSQLITALGYPARPAS